MEDKETAKAIADADTEEKGRVVKISPRHYQLLSDARDEVNRDPQFKRKIGFKRYIELLIEDHRLACVDKLKAEREGSEDWLRILHRESAADMDFYDWLKSELSDGKSKRGRKRKGEDEVQA